MTNTYCIVAPGHKNNETRKWNARVVVGRAELAVRFRSGARKRRSLKKKKAIANRRRYVRRRRRASDLSGGRVKKKKITIKSYVRLSADLTRP